MSHSWYLDPSDVKPFVYSVIEEIKEFLKEQFVGFYIHGSLAMGGFNMNRSDIDCLVVTHHKLKAQEKERMLHLLLKYSNNPYPLEISFLSIGTLNNWEHPSFFELHYSEMWRSVYEREGFYGNPHRKDGDLAAHIMVVNTRGICVEGLPITDTFPKIPESHYISSIMADFKDCVENIYKNPTYCILNMLRIYWFLVEGKIASKLEAGTWGSENLNGTNQTTVQKAVASYTGNLAKIEFTEHELTIFRSSILRKWQIT